MVTPANLPPAVARDELEVDGKKIDYCSLGVRDLRWN